MKRIQLNNMQMKGRQIRIGQTVITQHTTGGKPVLKLYLNISYNSKKGLNYKDVCSLEFPLSKREMEMVRKGNINKLKQRLIKKFSHHVFQDVKSKRKVFLGRMFDSNAANRKKLIKNIRLEGIDVEDIFRVNVFPRKKLIVEKGRKWELQFPKNVKSRYFELAVALANRGIVEHYYKLLKKGVIVRSEQKKRLARKFKVKEDSSRIWLWIIRDAFKANK